MADRFALENCIMHMWNTKEDIDLLLTYYCDSPTPVTEDEIANILIGLSAIHNMRCEKLFDTFKAVFELDEYRPNQDFESLFESVVEKKRNKKK